MAVKNYTDLGRLSALARDNGRRRAPGSGGGDIAGGSSIMSKPVRGFHPPATKSKLSLSAFPNRSRTNFSMGGIIDPFGSARQPRLFHNFAKLCF
jgi:hypothetical protein